MPDDPSGTSYCCLTTSFIYPEKFGATSEQLRVELEGHNIESRRVWKPLHRQPVFEGCRFVGSGYSERIFEQGLNLPSGTALTQDDVQRICERIRYRCCAASSAG
jgi:dTDP-4-amino-4,6-dideoxygalactose transaminase